jgi:hypothetical protein
MGARLSFIRAKKVRVNKIYFIEDGFTIAKILTGMILPAVRRLMLIPLKDSDRFRHESSEASVRINWTNLNGQFRASRMIIQAMLE